MSFLHPALIATWLLPLVALPVLIHLINLMRHRRVRWAAMDFLLESQKRNRNWIRLKQILLLLARMAAVAAIVLMLAGPLLSDRWSRLFSGGSIHHVLLVDDSLSMTDQWENTSAIDAARGVVEHLAGRAARQSSPQNVTVWLFSDAAAGRAPEILHVPARSELLRSRSPAALVKASQLAVGPLEALDAADKKIARRADEKIVLYLVSDFRTQQWRDPAALREALARWTDAGAKVELVRCVDRGHPNLAVTALAPETGIQAAGSAIRMGVEVTNFGPQAVRNVQVALENQTNLPGTSDAGGSAGRGAVAERQALPAVTIDRIEPGKSARHGFSVMFPTAGDHEVHARLGADAVAADNERSYIARLPVDVPVLIVDGQPGSDDARMLNAALRRKLGTRPQVERTKYLKDQPLDKFSAIYLVNIARLDANELTALEAFAAGGGGVVFFTGDATRPEFVNESLYRGGKGMFPLPLVSQASLIVDRLDKVPDVDVDRTHPICERTFAGQHTGHELAGMLVDRYFAVDKQWRPEPASNTRVVAWLRNKAPLIVEHSFGRGTCLAVLTTAAPRWNNWATRPTGVLMWLETQVYLVARQAPRTCIEVGQPIIVEFDKSQYSPEVQFVRPTAKAPLRETVQATPIAAQPDRLSATLSATPLAGIYEARLKRTDGTIEVLRYAVNVPTSEGNLRTVSAEELRTITAGSPITVHEASEFSGDVTQQAGVNLGSHWGFFVILLGLLMVEQVLAYSASYHLPVQKGHVAKGPAVQTGGAR